MYQRNMQIGKNTYQLKEYLTARDLREINRAMMATVEVGADGKPKNINYDSVIEQENKLIELCVKSINEDSEGVLDKVLDLPAKEYNELMAELRGLMGLGKDEVTLPDATQG